MLILTDRESKYAANFKKLIEKRGFENLAKTEFDAGLITGNEFNRVLQWLKETGWSHIDELIQKDQEVINAPEPERKSRREKNLIDAKLMRRLRNVFTRAEFAALGIKEMSYKEALALCEEKERERLKYGIRF